MSKKLSVIIALSAYEVRKRKYASVLLIPISEFRDYYSPTCVRMLPTLSKKEFHWSNNQTGEHNGYDNTGKVNIRICRQRRIQLFNGFVRDDDSILQYNTQVPRFKHAVVCRNRINGALSNQIGWTWTMFSTTLAMMERHFSIKRLCTLNHLRVNW